MYKFKQIVFWLLLLLYPSLPCRIFSDYYSCNCSKDFSKYVYECPGILIDMQPNSRVEISCNNENNNDIDELLAQFDIESFKKFNITELRFQNCRLPSQSLADIVDKFDMNHPQAIVYFYKNYNPDYILTSDMFKGLVGVQSLVLSSEKAYDEEDSQILKLEHDTLQNLPELKELSLTMGLQEIPVGLFDNLKNLKSLHLKVNNLDDLKEDVFKNLKNLIELDISDNYLESIPEELFDSNPNLQSISIDLNSMTSLPENLFANFFNLTHVSLSFCQLTDLSENLFNGSVKLEDINLSVNQLEFLPEDIFHGLHYLRHLDLSGNNLKKFFPLTFQSLINMRILNLEANKIESLDRNLFGGLTLLEDINLFNNSLSTLNNMIFQDAINLKKINLAENNLRLSQKTFGMFLFNNNNKLEVINLSKNNLTVLSEFFIFNKNKLKEFDVSYNQIQSISIHHLKFYSKEVMIDLRSNRIVNIDFEDAEEVFRNRSDTFQNQKIVVRLDENPIHCDCFSFNFLKFLTSNQKFLKFKIGNLACDSTGVSVRKLKLNNVTCSLEQLGFPKCSEACGCFYRSWDKSIFADCQRKNLIVAPKISFPNNFTKIEVNLKDNFLTFGPSPNLGYENVTKLFLSHNNLTDIAWLPPKLKVLELNRNNLTMLKEDVVAQVDSLPLEKISLGSNPWICDCSSLELYKFLLSGKTSKDIDINNITCQDGTSMILSTPEDLCPTKNVYVVVVITVLAIAIICVSILIFYHVNESKIKVWLYSHKICMWFVSEQELDKEKIYDAFVSYSHKDEDFIVEELLPALESGSDPYKLCLHIRDWIPGKEITSQVISSIENSRRTLVILSPHFLESVWGSLEFRTAHTEAMKEGRARVILIVYGDVDMKNLDGELKNYIDTYTYIKWGDSWFWDKLKYALPHKS